MNEYRIDKALQALADNVPKAPDKLVENMVRTVSALNAERAKRKGITVEQLNRAKQKDLTSGADKKASDAKKIL